jgi:hypothetical protein
VAGRRAAARVSRGNGKDVHSAKSVNSAQTRQDNSSSIQTEGEPTGAKLTYNRTLPTIWKFAMG